MRLLVDCMLGLIFRCFFTGKLTAGLSLLLSSLPKTIGRHKVMFTKYNTCQHIDHLKVYFKIPDGDVSARLLRAPVFPLTPFRNLTPPPVLLSPSKLATSPIPNEDQSNNLDSYAQHINIPQTTKICLSTS